MSDVEKASKHSKASSEHGDSQHVFYERPKGLRGFYYHPMTQVCMLGFVCFMCPGLFNALNGLGGGGQLDSTTNSRANTAVYATFAAVGFFSGTICNKLGLRTTLLIGTIGYGLYVGSYLAMNIHSDAGGFVVGAGAILGICAGLLWTAQGALMLAYPTEARKGVYIGVFWAIFNTGAVVGAAVSLGQNFHSTANAVGNGTYIGFLVLTGIGILIPLGMANPEKMIRTDGTKVITPRHPSWKSEIKGLYLTLATDPLILLLFPMFFASNWFYTWQFSDFNGALFNIRTRSLNNFLYYLAQIVGSLTIGALLDRERVRRRNRAFSAWTVLFLMVFLVHIWAYFYQKKYTRESIAAEGTDRMDFEDSQYPGYVLCYIFMGLLDAMWQTTAYWLMGAMSNDAGKLAYMIGFYKGIQSAGAAGIWAGDSVKIPFMNIFISTWVLLVAGLLFALPMIHMRVKDHTVLEDEVIARLDEDGHVLPTEVVAEKAKAEAS